MTLSPMSIFLSFGSKSKAAFAHLADFEHTVIISDDISCGVVPVDKTERAWREANGRLLIKISDKSEHVTRVFCKIPVVLK